ncbi:5,10-methenyltetrahydromethanopterin hydrogenase cofactor biosynthesis protein HmdC [Methanococcus voltae]|uniref:Uncharacterized conserved protein UCP019375 n=1 Tax=Methanococcus voltae (strain ATCC BAA-1334 / A3) TaxID=456320 RepID=D7DV43_METV3|nr:5,10-methenyltetrahydromethanopterin hydrogenase cofactor biosynthesis protein HmdC [Methanococcus voltae]MCS3900808.1 5,10-methenyltetrahydromethanopterin hydrogenase cofactor biosynthesis protein HmdC [Methanococcus voltae]
MKELIKDSINDPMAALELKGIINNKLIRNKLKESDIIEIVDVLGNFELEELYKIGNNFRKFPMGCDLVELGVGPCSSTLDLRQFLENCTLTDHMGFPIHLCAYAIADIAEKESMTPFEVMEKIYNLVDVPLDLDHFGENGPMRFPKEITHCMGECYNQGPPYTGCPKDRIHKRLLDKEHKYAYEFENWIKKSSTVCVNVVKEQGGEEHSASIDEMEKVVKASKKFGKGIEGIFHIGDGYDDLITGLTACNDLDVDVFVVEGGPFNRSNDRLKDFAKSIVASRILVRGGVVATNGAYEDECRVGLRSGLNVILTGFVGNHHGYMCGYAPGTAKRTNFGLPRVLSIVKEELSNLNICLATKTQLEAIAKGNKFLTYNDKTYIYPETVGNYFMGDAHWTTVKDSNLGRKPYFGKNLTSLGEELGNYDKLGLLGARYISWGIANNLNPEEVYISDMDPWVEKATVKILNDNGINAYACDGNDKKVVENSDKSVITTMIPEIMIKILKKTNAINLF